MLPPNHKKDLKDNIVNDNNPLTSIRQAKRQNNQIQHGDSILRINNDLSRAMIRMWILKLLGSFFYFFSAALNKNLTLYFFEENLKKK
jgi:hypothetical protein